MKLSSLMLSALLLSLPFSAQAQQGLTEDQLMQLARDRAVCGDRAVLRAVYDEVNPGRVAVTCGEDAEGFVPVAAGLGLGGVGAAAAGLALVAVAGGGSTATTNGTN